MSSREMSLPEHVAWQIASASRGLGMFRSGGFRRDTVDRLTRLGEFESGLHVGPARHTRNANASPEEAVEGVRPVPHALGRTWDEDRSAARHIEARDVVVVVTPYNAPRQLVH